MKVLGKCEFYLMILFVAVLFAVGTAASDDRTESSTRGTEQMSKKPTIMILGSTHLANPGMDAFNTKMDDVLAPKRQREIEQLVAQLKAFRPTKVAIEADERFDAKINANYHSYLEGTYELKRGRRQPDWVSVSKTDGASKDVLR